MRVLKYYLTGKSRYCLYTIYILSAVWYKKLLPDNGSETDQEGKTCK